LDLFAKFGVCHWVGWLIKIISLLVHEKEPSDTHIICSLEMFWLTAFIRNISPLPRLPQRGGIARRKVALNWFFEGRALVYYWRYTKSAFNLRQPAQKRQGCIVLAQMSAERGKRLKAIFLILSWKAIHLLHKCCTMLSA